MTVNTSSQLLSITDLLIQRVETISGISAGSSNDNFFRAGLSSIMLTRLKQYVENDFCVDVPMRLFYDQTDSVDALAQYILENGGKESALPVSDTPGGIDTFSVPGTRPLEFQPPLNGMMDIFNQQLDLMGRQLELLAKSRATPFPGTIPLSTPAPASADKLIFPLSSAQKRIYFLSRLEGGEAAYHITAAAIIEGRLDKKAFKIAFRQLIQRHQSLCTGVEIQNDELVQMVYPDCRFDVQDLYMGTGDPDRVVQDFVTPFDLSCPPLIRAGLGRLGENRHFLVMDAHHIAIDGFSYNILMPELIALYRGEILSVLPPPYSAYAVWEQKQIRSSAVREQEVYWLERLGGGPDVLELPLDFPRDTSQRFAGKVLGHTLDSEKAVRLKKLAGEQGITLFMLLLSMYTILLSKLTGETDIILGTPIDSRSRGDFINTVGMFTNTLTLRSCVREDISFARYLDQVKKNCLEAFDNQDYPFDALVDKLGGEHNLNRNPLFDIMFVYENEDDRIIRTDDLIFKVHDIDRWTVNFDLVLEIMESCDGLNIHLVYGTALFKPGTIERWLDYYLNIIDSVLFDPDVCLKDISVLPDQEKEKLLFQFNDTAVDNGSDQAILDLFEKQVTKTPSATAVVFGDATVSFQELDRRSGRIAACLHEKFNVGRGDVVGVRVRSSENLPAALLAAVKLGAAFVPIAPDSPGDRVRYILEDSGAKILLTQQACGQVDGIDIPCVDMDQLLALETVSFLSGENPGFHRAEPGDIFYIIYTSGTTGLPKGTLVTNRSLVNFSIWFRRACNANGEDNFLLVSSYAFDMAHAILWVTLLFGPVLHLVSEEDRKDVNKMADYITRRKISCLKVTPSYFYPLITSASARKPGAFSDLRLVVSGGEDIRHNDIQAFFNMNPHAVFINEYGPTEATIACIFHILTRENIGALKNRQIIGKPIDNTHIYILDAQGQPAPIGVQGEIGIGGAGVAKGYLNREELTRAKFQPDPFFSGGRIYLTGDYGRWLEDGTIEFFGRIDQQVKIRGYRVELGEIEQALVKHPGIKKGVVIAEALQSHGKELIAYVVGDAGLTATLLRDFLGDGLPEYMLPAYFVNVPEIPLTANGKLDRKALPNPLETQVTMAAGTAHERPGNHYERILAIAWESILGRKDLGIRDNYFALGGDSIKAVLICARLLKAGLTSGVRDVFEAPTIAGLAQRLTSAVDFDQTPVTGPALLMPTQKRFFELNPLDNANYSLGVLLTARNRLAPGPLEKTLKAIQVHHDALRIRYRFKNGRMFQRIQDADLALSFTVVDLRGKADAGDLRRQHLAYEADAVDPVTGPLMRTVLYQMDDADRLVMIIHHLVVDGVSLRILLEDLENGYDNALCNDPIVLSPKTDSVAVFAHCLDRYGKDSKSVADFSAWQERMDLQFGDSLLSHADPLNTDNRYENEKKLLHLFSQEETLGVMQGLDQDTTINSVLLTALARAIKKTLGRGSLVVDLEGHGREILESNAFKHPEEDRYVDVSRTVGWFTTHHPLYLKVAKNADIDADLRHVGEMLSDIPGQGLSHGTCLSHGQNMVQGKLQQYPVPEIGFNYLGRFEGGKPGGMFTGIEEVDIRLAGPGLNRWHELEVEGIILNERLEISLIYNGRRYTDASIQSLLTAYQEELKTIIAHCNARPGRVEMAGFGIKGLPDSVIDNIITECRVDPDNIKEIYPLSPLQEGMLFHAILEKDSSAFFEQFSFDILGELDVDAFEQSWNHLFDGFDVFRTAFASNSDDHPRQVVLKKRSIDFSVKHLTGQTEKEQHTKIQAFKTTDRNRGFDLARDILMRVKVFECGPARHHVVWSHHHIIMDGWSCGIMVETLLRSYAALRAGNSLETHATASYWSYIQWLARQDKTKGINYWTNYLSGYSPISLSQKAVAQPDGISRGENEYTLACLTEIIPAVRIEKLKAMIAELGVTLNCVVQCAWAILLGHHGVSDDVVFGSVVSGRPTNLPGVADIVGLFLNTVPLRIRLDNDQEITGMLKTIQARALESEPYHYVCLADIQTATRFGSDLLNNVLIFENYPLSQEMMELSKQVDTGFTLGQVEEFERTNYDLALEVYPGDTLTLNFKYNAAVYTSDQMNGYQQELSDLLAVMSQSLEQPLGMVRAVLMDASQIDEKETFLTGIEAIDEDF